jgi:hypothetical protein
MDEAAIREAPVRHSQYAGRDDDKAHELYHDDAVLELPQSGERFIGKSNILTWRKRYPAKVSFRIRRMTGEGDLWVAENLISYDDGPFQFVVYILRFRGDKIAHEAVYFMDGFGAPEWRRQWATMFDPLASVTPDEWREGAPFGIE